MNNQGLILKKLRRLKGLSLKSAAQHIGKSVGWLSEVENSRGLSRLKDSEFERIVHRLDGQMHRSQFKTWVATEHKIKEKPGHSPTGAILKYIRRRIPLSLEEASSRIGISKRYLTNLENGHKPIKLEMRNRIMRAYGYSPSSFCNLSANEKRAKSVPARYKINTLLNQLDAPALERVLQFLTQEGELS